MRERWTNRVLVLLAIPCITVFYTYINFLWCVRNGVFILPPSFEIAFYLHTSVGIYHRYLQKGIHGLFCYFLDKAFYGTPHAPLFSTITAIVYAIFNNHSQQIAYVSNAIYTYIYLLSIFLIARYYYNKKTAFLALFIFLTFPVVIEYSRTFEAHYPMSSFCTLSLFFLLMSDRFYRVKYAVAFGFFLGLVLLFKSYAIGYLLSPLLMVTVLILIGSYRKRRVSLFFMAVILALLIAVPWYIHNFKFIINYHSEIAPKEVWSDLFTLKTMKIIFEETAQYDLSSSYLVLLIVLLLNQLLIYGLNRKRRNSSQLLDAKLSSPQKDFYLISLSIIIGLYILVSIPKVKTGWHYALIIGPYIAIYIANLITVLKNKIMRFLFVGFVLCIGICNYAILQLGILQNQKLQKYGLTFKDRPHLYWYDFYFPGNIKPPYSDWEIHKIISIIDMDGRKQNKDHYNVYLPFQHHYFFLGNYIYFTMMQELDSKVTYFYDGVFQPDRIAIKESLNHMDYVVVKTGAGGFPIDMVDIEMARDKKRAEIYPGEDFRYPELAYIVMNRIKENPQEFVKIYETELPDGSMAIVYKKTL